MRTSDQLLDGERVVLSSRTHIKAMFLPFVLGLVVMLLGGYLVGVVGSVGEGWVRIAVIVIAVVVFWLTTVGPFLRWFNWTYTLTEMRLIENRGVLNRTGRIIPVVRINDVSYEKSLSDRMFGCGTLIVRDASEEAGLKLSDVPDVERFHREVSRLVLAAHHQNVKDDNA